MVRLNPFQRSKGDDTGSVYPCQNECLSYDAPLSLSGRPLPVGACPTGTMTIELAKTLCPGFSGKTTTIKILYDIPSGTQLSYHQNPGTAYSGTTRLAYLPYNIDGRRVLVRFKFAWKHGLMFTIGKSLTTNQDNQVTWTTIPHKTSLNGGPFGFPDSTYLQKCHVALDKLSVPSADGCLWAEQSASTTFPDTYTSNQVPNVVKETLQYSAPASLSTSAMLKDVLEPLAIAPHPIPSAPPACLDNLIPLPPPLAPPPITAPLVSLSYNPPPSSAPAISPTKPTSTTAPGNNCAICLEPLSTEPSAHLKKCQHAFHEGCIRKALDVEPKCPVCRKPVLDGPIGKGPSGTMNIEPSTSLECPGFAPGTKAISIVYEIPSGIQQSFHEHPGVAYSGTTRVAYLPNNDEGSFLLLRLKYAWMHGLTFRVGTSLTTGQPNQVTWTSVHHKTSLHGGRHGFPDNTYIGNCNSSLDALHVPSADECLQQDSSH